MNNQNNQQAIEKENRGIDSSTSQKYADNGLNQDDVQNTLEYGRKKYGDEKLNKVLQIYIKNPQILIDQEREIKERVLAKKKKETKQKHDDKLHLNNFLENETENTKNRQNNKTPYQEELEKLQQRKKEINNILIDNSNRNRSSFSITNKSPQDSKKEYRKQVDYQKKNIEYLENLKENIEKKQTENADLIKKKQHEQQKQSSEQQQVKSKLFEQTELQKLRKSQKEDQEKQKRKLNKSLSIESKFIIKYQNFNKAFLNNIDNKSSQYDANQKIVERQKEYLTKLKSQVKTELENQQQIIKKNEEEKLRVKNNVLTTIKQELKEQRRLTLDHHNLFLSKSTVSQSAKQISLPEINQLSTVAFDNINLEEEDKEKKKAAQSQLFFRPSSKKGIDEKQKGTDIKGTTTNLEKIKKLRPLPFINNISDWKKKQRIPQDSKIFIVMGGYKDFKKALLRRGWIENPQTNSPCFDLKWTLLGKDIDYDNIQSNQIVNHFQKNSHISSKIGLLNSLKNLVWFEKADPNVFFPVCFDMNDADEFNEFVRTFKLSKAESILKKYLRLYLEKDEKYNQVKLQAQVALSVLTRYEKDVNDIIDDEKESIEYFKQIPDEEWDILASDEMSNEDLARKKHFDWIKKLKLAYQGIKVKAQVKKKKKKSQDMIKKMIQNNAIKRKQKGEKKIQFDSDEEEIEEIEMDDFTSAVNQYLKDKEAHDPQYHIKGEDNIWIVKPAGLSRGRGITCYKNLVEIIDHAKSMELQMVVQKYIESPVLVKQRKFDIRIWVLVTDWNPLAIWYFDECYIRFSADNYSTKNLSNKFQHLTNNAISKKKAQNGEDEITLQGNMYTQEQLEQFFIEQDGYNVFQEEIKPKIFDIIKCSILSCSDTVESRKNSMELFGYDIMVDSNYNPWLLEVNTSPSLEYSTDITKRLVKEVLEDVAKVTIDYGLAQKSGVKKSELQKINTGKFIKIYSGQEIQDKGINSLGKAFICEGIKMKIRKPKKPKKTQKGVKKQITMEGDELDTENIQSQEGKMAQSQINQKEKEIIKKQQSRPQTAQSYKQ